MIILSDHLSIVALVSRYLTNELIERRPLPKRPKAFGHESELMTVCGISHPFGQLFPTSGQVTYALLSRSPLTSPGKPEVVRSTCMSNARRQRLS